MGCFISRMSICRKGNNSLGHSVCVVQIFGHCEQQGQMFSTDVAGSIHMLYCTVFRTTDLAFIRHCKERALFTNFNSVSFRDRDVGWEWESRSPPRLLLPIKPYLLLLLVKRRRTETFDTKLSFSPPPPPPPSPSLLLPLLRPEYQISTHTPSTYKPRLPPTLPLFST